MRKSGDKEILKYTFAGTTAASPGCENKTAAPMIMHAVCNGPCCHFLVELRPFVVFMNAAVEKLITRHLSFPFCVNYHHSAMESRPLVFAQGDRSLIRGLKPAR